MTVEVFYDLRVDINDTLVLNFDDNLVHQQGKNTQAVLDTAPFLKPGENTIRIIVKNTLGPHVLRVECSTLNLYSDPEWQYGSGPDAWDSAVPTIDPVRVETDLGEQSEGKTSYFPIPILILVFITTLFSQYALHDALAQISS